MKNELYRSRALSGTQIARFGAFGRSPRFGALGFAVTGAQTSSLVGAGSSLVKTKNPTVGYAATGASVGATFGPIGAAVGAVLGAIGGAFIGSKRPESELWDKYKGMAGQNPGHAYDNNFRNGAFVGLMRFARNTFPPRASGKYGPRDDAKFLSDMTTLIANAFRSGQLPLSAGDSAESIYNAVVGPWIASMGIEKNPDWARWEKQIVLDQIDAWLYDQPIIATSYSTAGYAQPRVSALAAELIPAAPPGNAAAQPLPPVMPSGSVNPVVTPMPSLPAAPVTTLPYIPPSTLPGTINLPLSPGNAATQSPPDLQNYIRSLLDQGATQQQAFTSAIDRLSASGVSPTPQIQAAVADHVKAASGTPSWIMPTALVGGVGALLFLLARKKRGRG